MTAAVNEKPTAASKPVTPPEVKFLKRYSPHHEFPLAGVTSFFLHGLVLGALIVGGLGLLTNYAENNKPVSMTVVQMPLGDEGMEGARGFAGEPGEGQKTELQASVPMPEQSQAPTPEMTPELKAAPTLELKLPTPDMPPTPKRFDPTAEFANISEEAKKQAERPIVAPKVAGPVKTPGKKGDGGTGDKKGVGGRGEKGIGMGLGQKGIGIGSTPGGKTATRQEILAYRWRFDVTGGGKEHADKLAAIGVTLAFPDPQGHGYLVARDLKRRPVQLQKDDLKEYQEAVKWYNTKPESIQALATELRLPFVPRHVMLLLPKDREEKMATEEARFAMQQRREPSRVQATWFDFRLQGGQYEPVAIRQE
jgi:hypothetical protein